MPAYANCFIKRLITLMALAALGAALGSSLAPFASASVSPLCNLKECIVHPAYDYTGYHEGCTDPPGGAYCQEGAYCKMTYAEGWICDDNGGTYCDANRDCERIPER